MIEQDSCTMCRAVVAQVYRAFGDAVRIGVKYAMGNPCVGNYVLSGSENEADVAFSLYKFYEINEQSVFVFAKF